MPLDTVLEPKEKIKPATLVTPQAAYTPVANNSAEFIPAQSVILGNQRQQNTAQQQQSFVRLPSQVESEISTQSVSSDPGIMIAQENANIGRLQAIEAQTNAEKQASEFKMMAYGAIKEDYDAAKKEYDNVVNEFKNAKVIDPQEKWGTGKRIAAAIAMGLGAYASAYTGGKNHAAEIINDSINRDISLQEQEIRKLGANVDLKKNALAQAYQKFGDLDQAKSALQIAALMQAKDDIMSKAKDIDNLQLQARKKDLLAGLDEKALQIAMQNQDKQVTTATQRVSSGKVAQLEKTQQAPLTESQAKANVFANAMISADQGIDETGSYATTFLGAIDANLTPEFLKTEKGKIFNVRANDWKEMYLRWASGANISAEDTASTLKRAIPQVNDPASVLKAKSEERKKVAARILEGVYGSRATLQPSENQNQTGKLKAQYGFQQQ